MDPITGISNAAAAIFNFLSTPAGQTIMINADADFHAILVDIIILFHGKITTPVTPAK